MTREEILTAAMELPPEELEELCEDLFQRCGPPLSEEQIEEARRRIAELDRGEVEAIPVYEVLREARESLRRLRERRQ